MKKIFQPEGGIWKEYAGLGVLRSVIDPRNQDNRKNKYINCFHQQAVSPILPHLTNRDVLDFGCGSGRFSAVLSRYAKRVFAFDITPEMLATAHTENGAPNIHYGTIDGTSVPLKDQSIDFILTVWVLQYAAREQEVLRKILAEFKRVLKPGGRFLSVEQVSFADTQKRLPECTVQLEDYLEPMQTYFIMQDSYPLRGARKRSFFQKLAVKRKFPEVFYPLFVRWDSARMKKLAPSDLGRYPYVDYVFWGTRR